MVRAGLKLSRTTTLHFARRIPKGSILAGGLRATAGNACLKYSVLIIIKDVLLLVLLLLLGST